MKTRAARAVMTGLAAVTHHVAAVGWHGAPAAAALAARQLQCAALCDFAVGHSTGVSAAAAGQRVLVGAGC